MISCVAATVRVMPHSIWRFVDALGQHRERLRHIVAGLHLERFPIDRAAIEPRRRAGFQTAEREAIFFQCGGKTHRGRFADAAGGNLFFADVNEAAQKSAGGQNHRAAGNLTAVGEFDPANAAIFDDEIIGFRFNDREIRRFPNRRLHGRRIKLAVGLGARTAHGRAFAAVENAELDAAFIGHMAHEAVQSIDFPHQMAFAEAADGRIAGHGADGGESVRHQGRLRAHTGGRGRGFTAGMAAANHDNVELSPHFAAVIAEAGGRVKNIRILRNVSRETSPKRYQTTAELAVLRPELGFLWVKNRHLLAPEQGALLVKNSAKATSRL